MTTTDRILGWATISAAGIDTDRVERVGNARHDTKEQYEILARDGATKLVFGEYFDDAEGGWDRGVYEQVGTADEPAWEMTGAPDWYSTPAEVLADAKMWAERN